jgi:hypothetical protein
MHAKILGADTKLMASLDIKVQKLSSGYFSEMLCRYVSHQLWIIETYDFHRVSHVIVLISGKNVFIFFFQAARSALRLTSI